MDSFVNSEARQTLTVEIPIAFEDEDIEEYLCVVCKEMYSDNITVLVCGCFMCDYCPDTVLCARCYQIHCPIHSGVIICSECDECNRGCCEAISNAKCEYCDTKLEAKDLNQRPLACNTCVDKNTNYCYLLCSPCRDIIEQQNLTHSMCSIHGNLCESCLRIKGVANPSTSTGSPPGLLSIKHCDQCCA